MQMVIKQIGYGAGTRDLTEVPNLLRIVLGQKNNSDQDEVYIIETNMDLSRKTGNIRRGQRRTIIERILLTTVFFKVIKTQTDLHRKFGNIRRGRRRNMIERI